VISIGARESPANVPGERKYTLSRMESGILGQCFTVVHPGNYGEVSRQNSVRASWQDRWALEKFARSKIAILGRSPLANGRGFPSFGRRVIKQFLATFICYRFCVIKIEAPARHRRGFSDWQVLSEPPQPNCRLYRRSSVTPLGIHQALWSSISLPNFRAC